MRAPLVLQTTFLGWCEIETPFADVQIPSNVPIAIHPFTDYFKGFEKILAVRKMFGHDTARFYLSSGCSSSVIDSFLHPLFKKSP